MSGTGTRADADKPLMAYQNLDYTSSNESEARGGFRAKDNGYGWGIDPGIKARYTAASFGWSGLDLSDNSTGSGTGQLQYHQFSCSKCHNPHASRLPRLMITNCLDTSHNTWDDSIGTPSGTNNDGCCTPSADNDGKRPSQWTAALSCLRVGDSAESDTGAGWNNVTPW